MYTHQKGILPFITSLLGILIPCAFFINAISILFPGFANAINSQPIEFVIRKTLEFLIGLGLYLVFPFFFGIFFSGLFPAIRLTKDGLKYTYFGGLIRKKIKWNEIDGGIQLPWGFIALVIDRPGFPLFNGLYLNRIYGKLVRLGEPVILLSPGISNRDKILQEIAQKTSKVSSSLSR